MLLTLMQFNAFISDRFIRRIAIFNLNIKKNTNNKFANHNKPCKRYNCIEEKCFLLIYFWSLSITFFYKIAFTIKISFVNRFCPALFYDIKICIGSWTSCIHALFESFKTFPGITLHNDRPLIQSLWTESSNGAKNRGN